MKIKCLYLKNFRNYKLSEFFFNENVNYVIGKNAIGKTTILEAISILSNGRSFRTNHLTDCIRFKENFFLIELLFECRGIEQFLSFYLDSKGKKISYNSTKLKSLLELIGLLPSVIFTPEDLSIINGSPKDRRRFINLYLSKIDHNYLYHLSRYTKSLQQRNALLKEKNINNNVFDSWEEQMAISAVNLIKARSKACSYFEKEMNSTHQLFNEKFLIKYKSQINYSINTFDKELEEVIKQELLKTRTKDISFGFTNFGPHKDDISIHINQKNVASFASEGQKKCCLAALKLSEWSLIYKSLQQTPLICIDDVKTNLDKERLIKLVNHSQFLGQIIFTTPFLEQTEKNSSFNIIDIEKSFL